MSLRASCSFLGSVEEREVIKMFIAKPMLDLLLWVMIETLLLLTLLGSYWDSVRRDWTEIKRLRADKEALTEILLAFLKGQVETQVPKENKT